MSPASCLYLSWCKVVGLCKHSSEHVIMSNLKACFSYETWDMENKSLIFSTTMHISHNIASRIATTNHIFLASSIGAPLNYQFQSISNACLKPTHYASWAFNFPFLPQIPFSMFNNDVTATGWIVTYLMWIFPLKHEVSHTKSPHFIVKFVLNNSRNFASCHLPVHQHEIQYPKNPFCTTFWNEVLM